MFGEEKKEKGERKEKEKELKDVYVPYGALHSTKTRVEEP